MKSQLEQLIDFIKEMIDVQASWLIRKDAFAWAAAGLYFSFLFTIILKQSSWNVFVRIYFLPLFSFILLVLVILLVHTQFSMLTSQNAKQRAATRLFFKLIKIENGKVPKELLGELKDNKVFPEAIDKEIKGQEKEIRKYSFFERPIITLYFIYYKLKICFNKKNKKNKKNKENKENEEEYRNELPSNIELEEAIIYDLLIIEYIFFLWCGVLHV